MFRIRFKELREQAGYKSQQCFADAFGISQSTVAGWEAGRREPSFQVLAKLALFLDCSADYLLGIVDVPTHIKKDLPDQNGEAVSVEYDMRKPPSEEAMAVAVEAARKALRELYSQD